MERLAELYSDKNKQTIIDYNRDYQIEHNWIYARTNLI
jgi:hypothetical protein